MKIDENAKTFDDFTRLRKKWLKFHLQNTPQFENGYIELLM